MGVSKQTLLRLRELLAHEGAVELGANRRLSVSMGLGNKPTYLVDYEYVHSIWGRKLAVHMDTGECPFLFTRAHRDHFVRLIRTAHRKIKEANNEG